MLIAKRTAAAAALACALGFSILRCQSGGPAFPAPDAGYSQDTVRYDENPPEKALVVSLTDSPGRIPSKLQLPDWNSLQQYDGIRLTGTITPAMSCGSAVFFVELARQHKQTIQIVSSSSSIVENTDGKLNADVSIRRPSCSGEFVLTVLVLPLDFNGEPIVPQPIPLGRGSLTVPKQYQSLTSL